MAADGRKIDIGDTQLHVVERGVGYPIFVLHGGPGLDHHMFGDYLDSLGDRFRLTFVDQRGQGLSGESDPETWNLQQLAEDVTRLGEALGLRAYGVLGHSFGAFVALQHAVDFPGAAAQTVVSSGLPSSRFLEKIDDNLARFEPIELREQVQASWEREQEVDTPEDVASLLDDQLPFHFRDPFDPRIQQYAAATAEAVYRPEVLRHFARHEYGSIEVEDQLGDIPQPVLVLAGRHDRTCIPEGAEVMAEDIPDAELVVFEQSAHMTFVEENEAYLEAVREFLTRTQPNLPHHAA